MININLKKVFILNEDIKYPKCYHCNKELSPYSLSHKELKKLSIQTINDLVEGKLLYLKFIKDDLHLLFICKHCLKGTFFKTNE